MDIKIIKDILDDAKECGCIAGISLSNGQLTHANFSKSKLFDFTADVLYNEKKAFGNNTFRERKQRLH